MAQEPLLLYLLARMHRGKAFKDKNFAAINEETENGSLVSKETKAKIEIYSQAIDWILTKQRGNFNLELVDRANYQPDEFIEDLRNFLRETALCVVQLGNENATD